MTRTTPSRIAADDARARRKMQNASLFPRSKMLAIKCNPLPLIAQSRAGSDRQPAA
jgi:hypothetical protein